MKLVHKITLGNALGIISIILIAAFSYHEFDLVLAKLRFAEIADSLEASFLRMRLSEKNYFLYKDPSELSAIKSDLKQSHLTVERLSPDIIKAIGQRNWGKLKSYLNEYEQEIDELGKSRDTAPDMQADVREAGRKLRLFSENMISLERKTINKILSASKKTLLAFFCVIIFAAITSSYIFFSKIFKNLRRIEKTAHAISAGNFMKIEGNLSDNELGSVMKAINTMCQELETRHEQLIQSKKLASLGILTSGVAHELGNPLNNISMVAQTYLSLYDTLGNEDRLEYMQTVLEECERIKKIVQDLLDFSRPKKADFKVASINNVIRNSIKLVQNTLDISRIKSQLALQEDLPDVFINEDRIREVLVNLLSNAVHAMPAGGTAIIRSKLAENPDNIIIEVEDTGKGIPPEFISYIFDPFFSTKGAEGTGLGLSISYGIIRRHNGKMDVKSKMGVGTTFIIELPVYRGKEHQDERI
ncbi:MAG: ATP-binding protein [Desulfobacterales bacterium]